MPPSEPKRIDLLSTIQWRLEEVVELFAAHRSIHKRGGAPDDPTLGVAINGHSGFWHPVSVGLQTALFVGIFAILDKNSDDSATLYSAIRRLTDANRAQLPVDLEANLDTIRNRYKKFRHKLFGHNDRNREALVDEFAQAGFSWDSVQSDLEELGYSVKVLYAIREAQPIPDREEAKAMIFLFDLAHLHARRDSDAFFDWYKAAITSKAQRND